MKHVLLIFKNDLKRRLKSPGAILVLLIIPILMTAIIGAIFTPTTNKNQLPKIKVLVADNDKSAAAKILLGALDAKELKEMFEITVVDEKKGLDLISRGKASALVIIPGKFTDRILEAQTVQLTVIKNPAEQFLPSVVEEFMGTVAVIMSGMVQVFQPEIKAIKTLLDTPLENLTISALVPYLEQSKEKILSLKRFLDPILIQLEKEIKKEKTNKQMPVINIYAHLLPGMSIMFILFIIEIFMRDLLTEREDGKLRRILFSPIRTFEVILARIFSGWLMGILVFALVVSFGVFIFNVAWGNYLYLLLLIAATCFWITSFFALLNAFFKNRNQAGAIVSPIILVFSAFGGSMLPVEQLPTAMRWVSALTLNRWFIKGAFQVREGLFPLLPFIIIFTTAGLLFFFASVSLKKRLST